MTSRILTSKKLLAGLLPLAAAAAMIAPGSAAAASRGFDILNATSHPIKLLNITGDGNLEGRPADGAVLTPGYSHRVEVQFRLFSNQVDTAHYEILNDFGRPEGTFEFTMRVDGLGDPSMSGCVRTGPATFLTQCHLFKTMALLLDRPGTVIDIPPGEGQDQADVLKGLCQKNNAATCTFTPTSRDTNAQTARHVIGEPVTNTRSRDDVFTIGKSFTLGITDSLDISVSTELNIADVVSVGLTASYGRTWTEERNFNQTVEVTLSPGYTGWLEGTEPVIRDTGNFTMKLGNTTWNLYGVSFESPNPNPKVHGFLRTCERAPDGVSSCPPL